MKKIMIIGGGSNQLPLIKAAKALNYYVVLCDYDKECPGALFCDSFYTESILDQDALLKVAKKENVAGIITNSELAQNIVSYLTDVLGLPTVPAKIMQRFRNKYLMREHLTAQGVSNIKYRLCNEQSEAVDFYQTLGRGKAIMKPLDNSASRGVFSILSRQDIEDHFDEAMRSNRSQTGVLLEEYIEGTEFAVDGICVDGKHTTLAISQKKHYAHNENVACELFYSYQNEEYDYDILRKVNDRVVEAGGLSYGMTHSEYKYFNGEFHLIEVAARGGGEAISTMIVPRLTGIDTVRILLECAVGDCVEVDTTLSDLAKKRAAVLHFFATPEDSAGVVTAIDGVDIFENDHRILKFQLEFGVGDYIKPAESDATRIGQYIALTDSVDELKHLMEEVKAGFKIKMGMKER